MTYTNNVNSSVTGNVYLVARNGIGQTVYIVRCLLKLTANATGSCADLVYGLPYLPIPITYSAQIFAVALSGVAISNSTSVMFTIEAGRCVSC